VPWTAMCPQGHTMVEKEGQCVQMYVECLLSPTIAGLTLNYFVARTPKPTAVSLVRFTPTKKNLHKIIIFRCRFANDACVCRNVRRRHVPSVSASSRVVGVKRLTMVLVRAYRPKPLVRRLLSLLPECVRRCKLLVVCLLLLLFVLVVNVVV
jgi:hypothetical protein